MKNTVQSVMIMSVIGLAGGVATANEPAMIDAGQGLVRMHHIYYNASSGERIITLAPDASDTRGASTDDESVPVWSSIVSTTAACPGSGSTTDFFFAFDNDNQVHSVRDWGDIEQDTVVDCVYLNWITDHPDTDTDFDSIGDGVEGLGYEWVFYDADDGRAINSSTRLPVVSVLFFDLPGNIASAGFLSGYSLTLDLADLDTDLSFEFGDTDGDCQSAAFCNSSVDTDGDGIPDGVPIGQADRDFDGLPDSDLDGDGLFDFAYEVISYPPGTTDFDGDGQQDGSPVPGSVYGAGLGSPAGTPTTDGMGNWGWDIDTTVDDAGFGSTDEFIVDGVPSFLGGFSCEPGMVAPRADIAIQFFTPGSAGCAPDLDGDGSLTFFDISMFISDFNAGGDYNGDGSSDFFDVSQFIADFNAGCP